MVFKKGHKLSEESRKKISNTLKERFFSEETRRKLSEATKGRIFTEERKLNMSKANIGKHKLSDEHKKKLHDSIRGKEVNSEHRQKLRESNIGKKRSIETKQRISIAKKGKPVFSRRGLKYPKELYPNMGLRKIRNNIVMPIKDTSIEIKIQNFLYQLQIEFYTHQYIHIEHGYQCDIFIPYKNLVIECYGDYWHKYPIAREIDNLRCQELREKGFKVFVFWEREIKAMTIDDFKNKFESVEYG